MSDMTGGNWSNSLVGTVISYALGVNDEVREAMGLAKDKVAVEKAEAKSKRKTALEFTLIELSQLYKSLNMDPSEMQKRIAQRIKDEA